MTESEAEINEVIFALQSDTRKLAEALLAFSDPLVDIINMRNKHAEAITLARSIVKEV